MWNRYTLRLQQSLFTRQFSLTPKESEKDFLNLNLLENLSLSHNQINVFPTEIQFLHKLTHLSLDHNALENLTFPKARRQATTFKKPILKYVDLSNNRIFAIALEYEQLFQSVEKLDLSNNQLITIPIVITKLVKLLNLDMSRVSISFSHVSDILERSKSYSK